MHLRHHSIELHLRHTSRLARGDSDSRRVLMVEIEHEGLIGRGEAAPIARYGQDAASAAQLAPRVDYADLDGNLLVTNDPFAGATIEGGRLVLPRAPGLGVKARP